MTEVVEEEVIPRLLQAHPPWGLDDEHRTGETFLALALTGSVSAMIEAVERLTEAGASTEHVFDALLAPTARRLVALWHEDRASYADITIALGRLKQLACGLAEATAYNGESDPNAASAYFASRPGEEQTFGVYVMGELLRWSGCRTQVEAAASSQQVRDAVRDDWYDVLCLSVSRDDHLDDLRACLDQARGASCNPDLCILVRGRVFEERPSLIDFVGADAAVADAEGALRYMGEISGHRVAA